MSKTTLIPALASFKKQPKNNVQALSDCLRRAITSGQLQANDALPSSRHLASTLNLARSTIITVYEQLIAEGYVHAQAGSATRVCAELPLHGVLSMPTPTKQLAHTNAVPAHAQVLAQQHITALPHQPFAIAVPQDQLRLDAHWQRLSKRIAVSPLYAATGYESSQGHLRLREQLVQYLRQARGVVCDAEQIIITEGAQQALYLTSKVLLQAHDTAVIENPVYPGLLAVLQDRQAHIHAVDVDEQGLLVPQLSAAGIQARAVFVTPSHQYPLGMPLSMSRRWALLEWARQQQAWIIEDDYDSELRYHGLPFPALQGLNPQQVIYIGTFSKVLAPSLRLGYVVVPHDLIAAFRGAKSLISRSTADFYQHVLAEYMRHSHFDNHIRRIRKICAQRQAHLRKALHTQIPALQILPSDQGMHMVALLPPSMNDVSLVEQALPLGLALRALSPTYVGAAKQAGLLLGFGGYSAAQLDSAVATLKQLL